jgi:hypothetical protein
MEPNDPSYEQSKQVAEQSRESERKLPSFGRQMYLGDFQLSLIHPQPKLDPVAVEDGEALSLLEGRYRFFERDVLDPAGDGPMIPEEVKCEPLAAARS